jgi:hypothetical protein
MPVVAGAVLPHAPLLLPEVTEVAYAPEVVGAARTALPSASAPVIVVSPHGRRAGVYKSTRGTLRSLGLPEVAGEATAAPDVAAELASAWERPLLDGEVDHGVSVPIGMAFADIRVVGVCLPEVTGPTPGNLPDMLDEARTLAGCLARSSDDIVVVASAHTSAALTPRAPLTERPMGRMLDDEIMGALATDVGRLVEIPARAWRDGGACGAGPLTVLGRLFEGRRAVVHAYEHPVGVGYVVATVELPL